MSHVIFNEKDGRQSGNCTLSIFDEQLKIIDNLNIEDSKKKYLKEDLYKKYKTKLLIDDKKNKSDDLLAENFLYINKSFSFLLGLNINDINLSIFFKTHRIVSILSDFIYLQHKVIYEGLKLDISKKLRTLIIDNQLEAAEIAEIAEIEDGRILRYSAVLKLNMLSGYICSIYNVILNNEKLKNQIFVNKIELIGENNE